MICNFDSFHLLWIAAFGADVGLIKTGVALTGDGNFAMPGEFDVNYDLTTHKLKTSFELLGAEGITTVRTAAFWTENNHDTLLFYLFIKYKLNRV